MANPIHIDASCSSNAVIVRPLSDQETADHQADQTALGAALQAAADDLALRQSRVRTLLLTHPELQVLIDLLKLKLS